MGRYWLETRTNARYRALYIRGPAREITMLLPGRRFLENALAPSAAHNEEREPDAPPVTSTDPPDNKRRA